jgi:hypothetical protein
MKTIEDDDIKYFNLLDKAKMLGWTEKSIKKYFDDNPPQIDDRVIIYTDIGSQLIYSITTIINPSRSAQKRIVVDHNHMSNGYSGNSFYRSGKNCHAPTGKVRLLPYHEEIGNMIRPSEINSLHITIPDICKIILTAEEYKFVMSRRRI